MLKIEVGKKYLVENRFKNPAGNIVTERYTTEITNIEERKDFLYVSHKPLDLRNGSFGAFRAYIGIEKPFGTKIVCEA